MENVSIIIPVYNSELYLDECIRSVINQTYSNLEIIIVDDCSSDSSKRIINSYKDKRIKKIFLKTRSGVSIARNKGIEKSTGKYICFLDSDDYWENTKIEKQINFIKKNNYTFIYSNYIYVKNNKKHIAKSPSQMTYKEALKNTAIFTSTVMFNMNKLNKNDIYMPNIERGQDTYTWWKVLKKGIIAYNINEALVYYRVGNNSLSHNKIKALIRTWALYKYENIKLHKRIVYFIIYIYNAIKRRVV